MNNSSPASKLYFADLDGLRTIAFLIVFLQHGFLPVISVYNNELANHLIVKSVFNGGTGVSIFFVLSGFLITYLLMREKQFRGKINIFNFYVRRTLRIWPLYFAVLTSVMLILPALRPEYGNTILTNIREYMYFLFLSNFEVIRMKEVYQSFTPMSINITWSVAIEEQFYLVWPWLIYLCKEKLYPYLFLLVIIISLLFRSMHVHQEYILYFHTLSVFSDLAVGGFTAWILITKSDLIKKISFLSKKCVLLIYLSGLTWIIFSVYFIKFFPSFIIFIRLINTIFFAFVIAEQITNQYSIKLSGNRLLSYWGKYTYGLYMLHPVMLTLAAGLLSLLDWNYEKNTYIAFLRAVTALILSLIVSYISYEYFEKHFLRIKNRFS